MIVDFACKLTKALYEGETPRPFRAFASIALRKLDMLDAATKVEDLRIPPGNRLKALSGSRNGQYSIRINDQWRICFEWRDSAAWHVEIVDYH